MCYLCMKFNLFAPNIVSNVEAKRKRALEIKHQLTNASSMGLCDDTIARLRDEQYKLSEVM